MKEPLNPPPSSRQAGDRTSRMGRRGQIKAAETRVEPQPGRVPSAVSDLLNRILADEMVLYVRTLDFHWNVRGMQFHSLHQFLEELYEKEFEHVDELAERVRAVGDSPLGSLRDFLEHASLPEKKAEPPDDPRAMIERLAEGHEHVIGKLREGIRACRDQVDDPASENLLTDLLQEHEKTLWMLKTHLDRDLR